MGGHVDIEDGRQFGFVPHGLVVTPSLISRHRAEGHRLVDRGPRLRRRRISRASVRHELFGEALHGLRSRIIASTDHRLSPLVTFVHVV
jgi:hypothetical protein